METNPAGAAIFAGLCLALLGGSTILTWLAIRRRDALLESVAVVFFGFSGMTAYETIALATGRASTISHIVASEFPLHPVLWMLFFAPIMALAGALAWHFVAFQRRARWWVFAAGAVVYLLGGIVAFSAGWMPT